MQEIPESFETKGVYLARASEAVGLPSKVKIQDLYLHFSILEIPKVDPRLQWARLVREKAALFLLNFGFHAESEMISLFLPGCGFPEEVFLLFSFCYRKKEI